MGIRLSPGRRAHDRRGRGALSLFPLETLAVADSDKSKPALNHFARMSVQIVVFYG
ncbi:hypothetical protein CHELA40_13331 [Chelatococcus asaccharovorans]|nr:hypothetical protein CHELA40_13331 [Chelatococcus asaccharovorans]CAH1678759.1 hypothetical protein CHELA17_62288 [Chelatococcus asaccharovorans]